MSLFAQSALVDPTLPSIVYAESGGKTDAKKKAVNTGPVLQSILIAKERRVAIISQQPVVVGGQFKEYKVKKIELNGVTLEGPQGLQVLTIINELKDFKHFKNKVAGNAS